MSYGWLLRHRFLVFAPLVLVLIVLAACGGDEATPTTGPTAMAEPTAGNDRSHARNCNANGHAHTGRRRSNGHTHSGTHAGWGHSHAYCHGDTIAHRFYPHDP
jgi:hypothetical protein